MNLRELKEMINLMNENGLTELEIEKDNVKIKLKKLPTGGIAQEIVKQVPTLHSHPPPLPSKEEVKSAEEEQAASDEYIVRSPMVGTFYAASSPEAEAFVSIGKVVKQDDVLCIIEAMKLMNEIKTEVAGTVTATLVKNGQAVEYDQPLFRIKQS